MYRQASSRPIAQIGTLMKKIQRQLTLSRIRPPITGPKIGASSAGTAIAAVSRPSRRGPAAWARIVCSSGNIIPPPIPWTTRKAIRLPADQATPQSTEPPRKQRERQHPHRLAAEAVDRPAGERDHHRQRQQVSGGDPLDRRQPGVKVAAERVDCDVDDRRVELDRDRADQHDPRELQQSGVEAVWRCDLGGRGVGRSSRALGDRRHRR